MENNNINQRRKPNNKGTKRLFKNPMLEKMTRTHISVPISLLLAYAAGMLIWAIYRTNVPVSNSVALYFLGLFSFTFVEYALHRFVYHMRATTERQRKIQYTMHGVHHEFPKDKDRLALPPVISLSIATALLFLLRLVIGDYTFGFLSGFVTGYSLYLFMHYIMHAYPPPKNFMKKLWVYHSIHHYKDETVYYGVSSPLWDFVFGTVYK
ncbi:hypothetical protein FUAX_14190 [Fulvitalea axinellae]|uniref:Fatty acid hydroxylase domain-containing protein n=1 Tax=Fulvitalea axinellae TaxID=1182444 RepID=A0AAU9CPW9_9BACT|nr:hypothetical protein FUAX_14190 [Fulvitalea axinellae]